MKCTHSFRGKLVAFGNMDVNYFAILFTWIYINHLPLNQCIVQHSTLYSVLHTISLEGSAEKAASQKHEAHLQES